MDLTRRQVLAGLLGTGVLAACSRAPESAVGSRSATPSTQVTGATATASASGTASATAGQPPATLPVTHRWLARAGEVRPSVKRQATHLLEVVGTWSASGGTVAAAKARARAAGFDPGLVDALGPLLGAGTDAVVQVRDAQYGGILATTSSVLVVVDQWRAGAGGAVSAGGTTVDVRLEAASPVWRVVAVHPAAPGPEASGLSGTARRVLADARISLPHAAHADVVAGRIHDSVLSMLTSMSARHVVDVSVLRSGHPLHVFGTTRTSDHPLGRAVDVWALDSRPLVVPANHALAASGMRLAVAHGAYNVGGPVRLGGPQYFSDATHQDHIHLGFNH
jgi:hypothetical protein